MNAYLNASPFVPIFLTASFLLNGCQTSSVSDTPKEPAPVMSVVAKEPVEEPVRKRIVTLAPASSLPDTPTRTVSESVSASSSQNTSIPENKVEPVRTKVSPFETAPVVKTKSQPEIASTKSVSKSEHVSPFEEISEPKVDSPFATPAYSTVTLAVLVDFYSLKSRYPRSSAVHFQAGDANIPDETPVNRIAEANNSRYKLIAKGSSNITLTSRFGQECFNTNKGNWDEFPILDGYIYTPRTFEMKNSPVFELSGLSVIPEGSEVTLTIWGVGDTPDSDSVFELFYNGESIGKKYANYDASEADTRVQFTFKKSPLANDLRVKWAQHGKTVSGLNGFALVAMSAE